jgi:hypothetical protein
VRSCIVSEARACTPRSYGWLTRNLSHIVRAKADFLPSLAAAAASADDGSSFAIQGHCRVCRLVGGSALIEA